MAIEIGHQTFFPTETQIDSVGSEANSGLYLSEFTAHLKDLVLPSVVLNATELGKRLSCDNKTIRRWATLTLNKRPDIAKFLDTPDLISLYIGPQLLVLLDGAGRVLRDAENQRYSIRKKGGKGTGNSWLFAVTKPGPKFVGYIQQPFYEIDC